MVFGSIRLEFVVAKLYYILKNLTHLFVKSCKSDKKSCI